MTNKNRIVPMFVTLTAALLAAGLQGKTALAQTPDKPSAMEQLRRLQKDAPMAVVPVVGGTSAQAVEDVGSSEALRVPTARYFTFGGIKVSEAHVYVEHFLRDGFKVVIARQELFEQLCGEPKDHLDGEIPAVDISLAMVVQKGMLEDGPNSTCLERNPIYPHKEVIGDARPTVELLFEKYLSFEEEGYHNSIVKISPVKREGSDGQFAFEVIKLLAPRPW